MVTKFLTLTAAALMLSTAPAFAQDCASKCAGKETKSVAASACTGKAESAAVAGLAGNDEAKAACSGMKAVSVAAKAECSSKTESVAAKGDCASKCSGAESTVAAGMAGNDEAKAACSAVKAESVAAKADCASKCSGAESTVAAGMAGNDEAKAACTEAEKAACASACSTKTEAVAAGMAGNDEAKAACASACSATKTEAVAAGMAGNDEHKCTGACGGSTEAVAAGMAGNDAMANGKDKAYRVGSKVNDFTATHAQTGASASLSGVAGSKATVLIFWNQNCPYVVEMVDRVDAFAKDYASKGVSVVAVDAGVNNTKDSVMAHAKDRAFPVMINEDSKVAAQFAASRTPEVFILDGDMNVVYHGAFDSGKENTPGSREHYAKVAVDEVLGGKAVSVKETRAFGCSLKYAKDAKPLPTS